MSTDLASLVVKLEAQTASYDAKLDQATAKLSAFKRSTNNLVGDIAKSLAGLVAVGIVTEFAKGILDSAVGLERLSEASGIGVEALAKLQFAAKQSGVDTEALSVGLKKLNVTIADAAAGGTSKGAKALEAMGIAAKDAAGHTKDASTVISEIAAHFADYSDGANKAAIAQAIFGRSGVNLIPLLDQGADGLKKFGDQAQAAGIVLSEKTAKAAEEFHQKLGLLKATLIDGLGAQILAKLLPTLSALADSFVGTADGADHLAASAEKVATGVKVFVTVGEAVSHFLGSIGDGLGAIAAVMVQIVQGHFSEAAAIFKDRLAKQAADASESWEKQKKIWGDAGNDIVDGLVVTAKRIKKEAPSLADAFDPTEFLLKLQKLRDHLVEQTGTLNLGTIAVTKYKLAHGDLADALDKTGKAGQALKVEILDAAKALETAQLAKEVGDIAASLKDLSGDTVGGALDKFNAQMAQLVARLHDVGDARGLKLVEDLKSATEAQAKFNKLATDASRIQSDLAITEAHIAQRRTAGNITDLEEQRQLSDARANAAAQLADIATQEKAVADASGMPTLIDGAKRFGAEVDALKAKTNDFTNGVRTGLEDAFAHNFSDLITGAKSFRDALFGFLKDIEKQFADLVAKNFAQQLFAGASGTPGAAGSSSGGILGSIAPLLAGLFGGAHADGGTIPAGKVGLVGERGPELAYAGAGGLNIVPMGKAGGGMTVSQTFVVQAPQGTVSRATQMQIAAGAASGLAAANRRNN